MSFKFEELHLLPRVVFAMGGIVFIAEVVRENWGMAVFGASISFLAIGSNHFLIMLGSRDWKPITIAQGLLALCIAVGLAAYALHRCEVPNNPQPRVKMMFKYPQ